MSRRTPSTCAASPPSGLKPQKCHQLMAQIPWTSNRVLLDRFADQPEVYEWYAAKAATNRWSVRHLQAHRVYWQPPGRQARPAYQRGQLRCRFRKRGIVAKPSRTGGAGVRRQRRHFTGTREASGAAMAISLALTGAAADHSAGWPSRRRPARSEWGVTAEAVVLSYGLSAGSRSG
ncbi:MAG: DUF1016 N-terminal domain-containing protein [Solirubrobacteraceae bacterium]